MVNNARTIELAATADNDFAAVTPGFFSSHLEPPRVESAAMRTRIYPWIILTIVLSLVILYAPSDLYKYARKEARTAIVKLQLKMDRMRMRYGPPAAM